MSKASASLVLDTRRPAARHDNKFPVKLIITFRMAVNKYKRIPYPTNEYLLPREFDRILKSPKNKKEEAIADNLNVMLNRAISIINKVKSITPIIFDQLYGSKDLLSLSNYFTIHLNKLKEDRPGDYNVHLYALKSFEVFNKGELYFNEITPDWLHHYEKHMIKAGKSITTIGMYLRALREVYNNAIATHMINADLYPFGRHKYSIRTERKFKMPLNEAKLEKLKAYTPASRFEKRALSFWFFCYYCNGINMTDALHLRCNDIQDGFIIFDRNKTRRTKTEVRKIFVPMRPELQDTINAYGQRTLDPTAFIFEVVKPGMTGLQRKEAIHGFLRRINKQLKKIAAALGIRELKTSLARHTFANRLLNSGISNEYLQYALGHSNPTTTEHYKGSFAIDKIKKASEML